MNAVLVDTGFLVALGIQSDPRHASARSFMRTYRGSYLVPGPVVVETCYFLSTDAKVKLLDWLSNPRCTVLDVPASAFGEIGALLQRYANLDPDFTDAALMWLAAEHARAGVLTVDRRDFETFRIRGRRKFRIVDWTQ